MNSLPTSEQLWELSDIALGQMELTNLDLAAQAMKRAKADMELARLLTGQADTVRWLMEHRNRLINVAKRTADGKQQTLCFEEFSLRRTA